MNYYLDKEYLIQKKILKINNFEFDEDFENLSDFEKSAKVDDLFLIYLSDYLNLSFEYQANLNLSFFDEDIGVIILTYQEDEYDGHGDYDHQTYKYLIDYNQNKIIKEIKI